ncbi:hypothetical protein FNF29_01361 [Cafeteria roenbergensis]|uniref:Cystatin domain-containing protein n=1 Tax=Cafeteria roenbergensis TaxID=33653 RepID=A0A5A8CS39_CAFRO|nr:hypothetical protein FNF29_01361 [Cafeteria roenbergensis]|eukprot:KAA0155942.1 hypothetical protein FNF29_01361 [Cafeteria roenbergensis]
MRGIGAVVALSLLGAAAARLQRSQASLGAKMDGDNTLGLFHAMADIEEAERMAKQLESIKNGPTAGWKPAPLAGAVERAAAAALTNINQKTGNKFRYVLAKLNAARRAGDVFEVSMAVALTPCLNPFAPSVPEGTAEPPGSDCEGRASPMDALELRLRATKHGDDWEIRFLDGFAGDIKPLPGDVWFPGDA